MLLRLNFKIPGLSEEPFLASLLRAETNDTMAVDTKVQGPLSELQKVGARPEGLKEEYLRLLNLSDRQEAGRQLERLLNELFALFELEPRPPFRVIGEQIDGSCLIDYETYLVEAKWTEARIQESELLVFRGKVEGKSSFTRGMFVSVNGFTDKAIEAITRGKSPTFFLADGYDLFLVLDGKVSLTDLLRHKVRKLTEEGLVLARFPLEG